MLIAAYSGRALAQSARRAGYQPLVADAFGDLDMREAAHAYEIVPGAMQSGFRAKQLVAALDRLVARAPSKPVGVVLGSGLEDKPRLWDLLDKRYRVLGCNAETVRKCKDPRMFFPLLDELGIAHPQCCMNPPENPEGWITKRIGGSGGRHIRFADKNSRAKPRRYFQKVVEGARVSVSALVGLGIGTDLSRQWCAPTEAMPFRYGGATLLSHEHSSSAITLTLAVDRVARQLRLRGLVSFDFILNGQNAYLLEINPRPGASHDVHDDESGSLFAAHLAVSQGADFYFDRKPKSGAKTAAILHADRGAVTLGNTDWPEWSADRGAPGTHVPQFAPLATVFANASTADAAEALARERLAILTDLIYGKSI